ncbi:MAG: hypothetical protein IJW59_01165 [Clostridia bacterium]|nr:hypothetical protein [Clostridia bacterium]
MKKRNKFLMGLGMATIAALSPLMMTGCGETKQDLTAMNMVIDRAVETIGFEELKSESSVALMSRRIALAEEMSNTEMETIFDKYITEDQTETATKEELLQVVTVLFPDIILHLRAVDRGLFSEGNDFHLDNWYGQEFDFSIGEVPSQNKYIYNVDWNETANVVTIKSVMDSVTSAPAQSDAVTIVESYGETGFSLKSIFTDIRYYVGGDGSFGISSYNYSYVSLKVDGNSVDEFILARVTTQEPITDETVSEWAELEKDIDISLAASKDGKTNRELTDEELDEVAKIVIEDMGVNYAGFENKLNVEFDEVEWIKPAFEDLRDLGNKLNGVE